VCVEFEPVVTPIRTAESGRDLAGRFAKGNKGGPGRPRRRDLYTVAAELAERDGVDLEEVLWQVSKVLIGEALAGDVAAARLLLSHLCGDPESANVGGVSLIVATGVPRAAARLEAEGKPEADAEIRAAVGLDDDAVEELFR
jgi:hypothetical protein